MERLEAELKLPRPLCTVLAVRGMSEPEEAKAFLRPSLESLHPPGDLPDLPEAAERIVAAIQRGETLLIHGDYDVDGMAGTALLTRWFRRLGGRVVAFLPHRLRHGYDFGKAGLEAAVQAGASLVVTVDCGTVASNAVREARRMGIDVIVTDHHLPEESLPPALAVVNPARADSRYPNRFLCGTGVAYKLAIEVARRMGGRESEVQSFLDLVALATVADLVPLVGENRVLVRHGLNRLGGTDNAGLKALMEGAGLDKPQLSARSLGFVLAPRLNAVGRLGDPREGMDLLLTDEPRRARELAEKAAGLNRARQDEDRKTLEEVLQTLARDFDPARDFAVVLAGEGWHPGVVGIVASRVVERVHRPVVLVALDGEKGRGSARSIPGFHLLEGIRACRQFLGRFGGHALAAGMDICRSQVASFREAFNAEARRVLQGRDLRPILQVDARVDLAELTPELHHYLRYLGPHGIGNPRPLFLAHGARMVGRPRVVGEGHLKMNLANGRAVLEGIGFGLAHRIHPVTLGPEPLDLVFHLQENHYRGVARLQLAVRDLRCGVMDEEL